MRRKAVEMLSALNNPRGVDILLDGASDDDSGVRCDIAQALGRSGDPRAAEVLYGLARDTSPFTRSTALEALCELGEPAEPVLERLLQVPECRQAVLRALAIAHSRLILPLLSDGSEETRKAIVEALDSRHDEFDESRPRQLLIDLPDMNDLPRLAALLRFGGYAFQRIAASQMATFGREAFPYLAAELNGPNPDFQVNCFTEPILEALASIQDPRAVRVLVDRLIAERPDSVDKVIEALRRSMDASSVEDLLRGLSHCAEIALLLGDLGDERAIPYLLAQLDGENHTRGYAAEALGNLHAEVAVDKLLEIGPHCFEAVKALAKIGDERIIEDLVAMLANDGGETVVPLLVTIGEKHRDVVIDGLVPLLEGRKLQPFWAAVALVRLEHKPERLVLLGVLADALEERSAPDTALRTIASAAKVPDAVLSAAYDAFGYEFESWNDGDWSFDTPSYEKGDAAVRQLVSYPTPVTSYFLYRVTIKKTVKSSLRCGPSEKTYRFRFKNQRRLAKAELARRGFPPGKAAGDAVAEAVRQSRW